MKYFVFAALIAVACATAKPDYHESVYHFGSLPSMTLTEHADAPLTLTRAVPWNLKFAPAHITGRQLNAPFKTPGMSGWSLGPPMLKEISRTDTIHHQVPAYSSRTVDLDSPMIIKTITNIEDHSPHFLHTMTRSGIPTQRIVYYKK